MARHQRPGVESMAALPGLLAQHDVVVVALPLTQETEGLIDAAFLAAMRDGAVLVNVARGKIVHTTALVAELQAQRLRAFLDVTEPEPLLVDHPLWTAPGVLDYPSCRRWHARLGQSGLSPGPGTGGPIRSR